MQPGQHSKSPTPPSTEPRNSDRQTPQGELRQVTFAKSMPKGTKFQLLLPGDEGYDQALNAYEKQEQT